MVDCKVLMYIDHRVPDAALARALEAAVKAVFEALPGGADEEVTVPLKVCTETGCSDVTIRAPRLDALGESIVALAVAIADVMRDYMRAEGGESHGVP